MLTAHAADPHPLLRRLREQAPAYRREFSAEGPAYWYLTRYCDVRRALLDPGIGRQLGRLPAHLAARHREPGEPLPWLRRNVFNLDPPDHTRLRALLAPAFSARAVAVAQRHAVQAAGDLVRGLDGMAGPVDLIKSLALPLPVLVVASLIGFPLGLSGRLRGWSDVIATGQDADAAQRAGLEFTACVEEIVAGWAGDTPDTLLSQLVAAELSGQISREELLSAVFQVLLAGDETTVGLIGNGVLELLRHPQQLALLRARPQLIDSAVEEMLRYNGPVGHSRPLYALADVEIGDTVIPQGDVVVPVLLAANRDPAVFPDPDNFDITRAPNPHLGLGHGPHFCVGAALGRLQARTAIGTLVRHYPRLTLAIDPDGLDWAPGLFLHTIRQLPVLLS